MDVRYETAAAGALPDLLLAPETELRVHYDQRLTAQAVTTALGGDHCVLRVRAGTADGVLALRVLSTEGGVALQPAAEGVVLHFEGERGRHLLLLGAAGAGREAELLDEMRSVAVPEEYAAEAAQAWHRRWGDAWVRVPVPEYQALWARSLYYVLCSYAPDVRCMAAPMGWSGNGWPFHFPQDLSYVHPALLRLGHHDIARAWVEFYHGRLADMLVFTRRSFNAEGVMWAWEFPIGRGADLLRESTPNWCQYEIHNAAYPARMAYETALHLRDPAWTREIAWPVVRESARFFASVLRREAEGTWGIQVEPSFGQDEMGGENARNYLCALFSARYCLQTAIAMASELGGGTERYKWKRILADGLAFGRLLDPATGLWATCEGLKGSEQFGREKHPVQLNPLNFLPLGVVDAPVRRAYERRYELCAGVRDRFYHGWTLGAYWLAAAHMGDAAGLAHELGQALPARYVDADWIQIYETSNSRSMPFYVTSHGLFLQALNDALISDYWGETRVGAACPEAWQEVAFANLHTADGRLHSGEKKEGGWKVEPTRVTAGQ